MPFVRLLYEKVVFYVLLCVRVCACVCVFVLKSIQHKPIAASQTSNKLI